MNELRELLNKLESLAVANTHADDADTIRGFGELLEYTRREIVEWVQDNAPCYIRSQTLISIMEMK